MSEATTPVASPRFGLPAALMMAAGVLGGCQETVLIGTECAHFDLPCSVDAGLHPAPTPSPEHDAGDPEPDEERPEAGPAFTPNLVITNPDFERGGGIDGDVVIRDIAQTILQVVPLPITTELSGWYACWPFSVTTNSKPVAGVKTAMGDYLSFVPSTFSLADFVAVRQNLEQPVPVNEPVHLQLQAIADSAGGSPLFLEVRGETGTRCEGNRAGVVLGRSASIADSTDWKPICVTFQSDTAFPVLMLKPAAEGGVPTSGASLLIDSARIVERCP
ncbi:MAG: hypothetical protein QM778_26635 [Myxococcales bacterium]